MDGWQEEKGGDKRDMFSDPESSQPIQGQRTRGRTTASGEVVVKCGEARDEGWPVGEGAGDGAEVSNLGAWENGGTPTKIQKKQFRGKRQVRGEETVS